MSTAALKGTTSLHNRSLALSVDFLMWRIYGADFELKLMDIDAEQLGIPDTDYTARYGSGLKPHAL